MADVGCIWRTLWWLSEGCGSFSWSRANETLPGPGRSSVRGRAGRSERVEQARLWEQHGKTKEAHQKLAETYNWFTEGFDTKDLRDAKALLEELA